MATREAPSSHRWIARGLLHFYAPSHDNNDESRLQMEVTNVGKALVRLLYDSDNSLRSTQPSDCEGNNHMSGRMTPRIILLAGIHPLIAEDSRLHARSIAGSTQYEVVESAADEHSLLPVVNRLKPHFVLFDLLHANSLQTIRRIATIKPSCCIMAVTGARTKDVPEAAFSSGASGVLYRTDVSTELLDAIRTVRAGRWFLSYSLSSKADRVKTDELRLQTGGISSLDELILCLMLRGCPASRIARALGLSSKTVRLSITFLKQFYGVRTKQELKEYATAIFCRS
jgi:DNA-binding NarL/FixJ family response regulator